MALRSNLITEPILLTIPDEAGKLDFAALFGNPHPVELEIGSGKGTFLLAISEARPEVNFIGFEWAKEYALYAADRLRRHNRLNTRIVNGEATWWLRCHVPDSSIDALHIYFPDPWPKTRHHKRRIIQESFIKEAHRFLKPGGILRLVTDHADYFAWMQEVLQKQTYLDIVPFDSPVPLKPGAPEGSIVGTNFERKYIAEGRTFHATAAKKRLETQGVSS
jgi:tRNA (guanine-N7-)-methyltransferase